MVEPQLKRVKCNGDSVTIAGCCVVFECSPDEGFERVGCDGHEGLEGVSLSDFVPSKVMRSIGKLKLTPNGLPSLIKRGHASCKVFVGRSQPIVHFDVSLLSPILCRNPDSGFFKVLSDNLELVSWMMGNDPLVMDDGYYDNEVNLDDISDFLDSISPKMVPEAPDPPGLTCQLLPFQRRTLNWALTREQPSEPSSDIHPLFREVYFGNEQLFYNPFSGRLTTQRFTSQSLNVNGGLLCQTMGLGKTVEIIALILSHPAPNSWIQPRIDSTSVPHLKATLVVCPPAVLGQWQQEVAKHAPFLRVITIFTVADFDSNINFADVDLILTSYDLVRRQHVYFTANEASRTSRSGTRAVLPTPFLNVSWWRIVLDEAQRIASESATTESARCLSSHLRWIVTGTPICRRLGDLCGLLSFLGQDPFGSSRWFQRLILNKSNRSIGLHTLRYILSHLMYRHGKASVECDIVLPPMIQTTIALPLSDVEHVAYSKLMRKCRTLMMMPKISTATRMARLRPLLLRLRKICCCPFLVGGRAESGTAANVLPIVEIKQRMCREASVELDAAIRYQRRCQIHFASAVAISDRDLERSQDLIRSVLTLVEDSIRKFLTPENDEGDQLRLLSGRAFILESLGEVQQAHDVLLRVYQSIDELLLSQLSKMVSPDLETLSASDDNSLSSVFETYSRRFTIAVFSLMMNPVCPAAVQDLLAINVALDSYVSGLSEDIATSISETPMVLASLRGRLQAELKVSVRRRNLIRDLIALRVTLLECLSDLSTLSLMEGQISHGDVLASCRHTLTLLPIDRSREEVGFVGDEEEQDDENFRRSAQGVNRVGFRLDPGTVDLLVLQGSIMTASLRTIEKLLLDSPTQTLTSRVALISVAVGKESAPISASCSSWISIMFSALRLMLYIRQQITNNDENDGVAGRSWERCFCIREELSNLYRRQIDQLETTYEDVRAGVFRASAFDSRRAEVDLRRADQELHYRENEHRYILQKFTDEQEGEQAQADPDLCPICRDDLIDPIVTPCGHIFCTSCLTSYIGKSAGAKCPLRCRIQFSLHDCLVVEEPVPVPVLNTPSPPATSSQLLGDYGAKINDLVIRLLAIRAQDPTAKSLVFSQFTDMLHICHMALADHDIGSVQLQGDSQTKAKCIDLFVNSNTTPVFLIPMASGASGLTMVVARFAFIMEPNLNPNMEDQAVSRIHRIGQTQPTQVLKFIAASTIEERIAAIQERRRASGDDSQKGLGPEVFDETTLNDIFTS